MVGMVLSGREKQASATGMPSAGGGKDDTGK
jgi:hypothetical protein